MSLKFSRSSRIPRTGKYVPRISKVEGQGSLGCEVRNDMKQMSCVHRCTRYNDVFTQGERMGIQLAPPSFSKGYRELAITKEAANFLY